MIEDPSIGKSNCTGRNFVVRMLSVAVAVLMLMAVFPLIASEVSADGAVTIVTPTEDEDNIVAGRDFYVIGTYGGLDLSDGFVFFVEMKDGTGATVRTLKSEKIGSADDIYYNYKCASTWKQGADPKEFSTSMMPDLVYDSSVDGEDVPSNTVPSTFLDSWRKCYVGASSFSALISGGVDDGVYEGLTDSSYKMRFNNADGSTFEKLTDGTYTIDVTFTVGGKDHSATKTVTIGENSDKLCSRFSPDIHKNKAFDLSSKNDWRIYTDPFVGYWDSSNAVLPDEIKKLNAFCEIKPKWHVGELLEYCTPTVNVVMYNISKTCATQTLEIASCIDSGNLGATNYYYYDIGEPTITTSDGTMDGKLKKHSGSSSLVLVRADDGNDYSDNVYDPNRGGKVLDTDLSDGLYTGTATTLGFYGFVLPIDAECVYDPQNGYSVDNRISSVTYTFFDKGGNELGFFNLDVELTREYSDTNKSSSMYEFMHIVDFSVYRSYDEIVIMAQAFDTGMNAVDGAVQTVTVHLGEKPAFVLTNTVIAVMMSVMISLVVMAVVYLRK